MKTMEILFRQSEIIHSDYEIILTDMIDCVSIDLIIDRTRRFIQKRVFPKMLEYDFTQLEYTYKPAVGEKTQVVCMYYKDGRVLVDIIISPIMMLTTKGDRARRDALYDGMRKMIDFLREEFIKYCEENTDWDSDTKINNYLRRIYEND